MMSNIAAPSAARKGSWQSNGADCSELAETLNEVASEKRTRPIWGITYSRIWQPGGAGAFRPNAPGGAYTRGRSDSAFMRFRPLPAWDKGTKSSGRVQRPTPYLSFRGL